MLQRIAFIKKKLWEKCENMNKNNLTHWFRNLEVNEENTIRLLKDFSARRSAINIVDVEIEEDECSIRAFFSLDSFFYFDEIDFYLSELKKQFELNINVSLCLYGYSRKKLTMRIFQKKL